MTADDCYEADHSGQLFLCFFSAREQRALPYALLTDIELSDGATILRLIYPHYQMTVHGRHLGVIFEKVTATRCTVIRVGRTNASRSDHADPQAIVTGIHMKRMESR